MINETNYQENIILSNSKLADEKDYWLKKLEGEITLAKFPYNKPKINQEFTYKSIKHTFNNHITEKIWKISQGSNYALYILLLSGIKFLHSRYSGSDDITVAMPVFKNMQSGCSVKNLLLLRSKIYPEQSYKEMLSHVKKVIEEADKNANLPIKALCKLIDIELVEDGLDLGSVILLENIHNMVEVDSVNAETTFKFNYSDNTLKLELIYNANLFESYYINQIISHLNNFYSTVLASPDIKLSEVDLLSHFEKETIIEKFNNSKTDFNIDKPFYQYFQDQVILNPQKTAIVFNSQSVTYKGLDIISNQIAHYLVKEKKVERNEVVGIYMENSTDQVVAIIGIMKAGAAYVPIDSTLPEDRIKSIIDEAGINVLLSKKKYIRNLNRLQWVCESLHSFLCLDTYNISIEKEVEKSQLMHEGLWEYVGQTSNDEISGGGWSNSYTGENFTKQEMDEYGDNVLAKIKPLVNKKSRVLEIGCASGITMYRIAPLVSLYFGTDLSKVIIEKNEMRNAAENIDNIKLATLAAHDIDKIEESNFDVIIINSVIQCFHGHNYLRDVILKAIKLLNNEGVLFIGDVMDLTLKNSLISSIIDYKNKFPEKTKRAKVNWDEELFLSKAFFEDINIEFSAVTGVYFSNKIYTIENELTRFRYDVLLSINKSNIQKNAVKHKYQDDFSNISKHLQENLSISGSLDDLAYVIYTSGTTGNPKGVMINHRALMNLCAWHNNYYSITSLDNATRYAGFGFDASVWELFPYLIAGATVHIIDKDMRLDLKKLNDYFERNNITISFLPTQVCEQFFEYDNDSLRYLLTGGDKLKIFKPRKYRLFNNYGPTENAVVSTAIEVQKDWYNIPIGKPISNVQIYIVDKYLNAQPIGVPGELCISGESLSTGYLNSKNLTQDKFVRNPFDSATYIYKTGDLARWMPDGNIEFMGRIDQQVKIRSYRIELGDIESTLLSNENIKEAVVIDRLDERGAKYLHAFIVLKNELEVNDIQYFLAQKLPYYMLPSAFSFLKSIPITINGKVNRKALISTGKVYKTDKQYKAPKNEREEQVLQIWKEVLGIKDISIDDNFFDIGGNSLKAVSIYTQLSLEYDLEVNHLFEYQTIEKLAEKIKDKTDHLNVTTEGAKPEIAENEPSDYLKNIDNPELKDYYEKIHLIYSKIDISDISSSKTIFLTGGTGYLGLYLINSLLTQTNYKIFVLVRSNSQEEAFKRLQHKLDFHFSNIDLLNFKHRIFVVNGDICKSQLGLNNSVYAELTNEIDYVINAAANVKHYGNYEDFYSANVTGVNILIHFAFTGKKKEFHHISTVGLANGIIKDTLECFFTEDNCELGQQTENYYLETKLIAEKSIIEARKKGLSANIYRVGNLMFNSNTGIFQENINDNGFYKILKSFISIGYIPNSDQKILDFSFVNRVSDAIILLLQQQNLKNEVFHVINHNRLSLNDLNGLLASNGIVNEHLNWDEFLNLLHKNYNSNIQKDSVESLWLHSRLLQNQEGTKYHLVSDKTRVLLGRLGFNWETVKSVHINKMIEHCIDVDFIKEEVVLTE